VRSDVKGSEVRGGENVIFKLQLVQLSRTYIYTGSTYCSASTITTGVMGVRRVIV
jgi:hypothetical protein